MRISSISFTLSQFQMSLINANNKKLADTISLEELLLVPYLANRKIKGNSDYGDVTEIQACFNFISSISIGSHTFPNLSILSLSCNNIREIPPLDCCPNLLELNLNRNAIVRLNNLSIVPSLRVLSLSSNLITSLENISGLEYLEKLILSCNQIRTIDYATLPTTFPNLSQLGLLDNNLSSLDEIEQLLCSAPSLTKLSLGLNPLTSNNMLSTSYLLTDLRVPRRDIFNPGPIEEIAIGENAHVLHIRRFIMISCPKLEFLDLSPIASQ